MFIAKKDNQYWLWPSKKSSLDCMPWYKSDSLKDIQIKYFNKLRQIKSKKVNLKLMVTW